MSKVKYKLKYPIEWGDLTIENLEFRRPKGKDVYHFPDKPTTKDFALLAGKILVGDHVISKVIDELDVEDFMNVVEIVGNFFESSPKTGDNPGQ